MPSVSRQAAVLGRRDPPHLIHDPSNPEEYANDVLLCVILSCSWTTVLLRCVARYKIRSFEKDDLFMVATAVCLYNRKILTSKTDVSS
jgi:hypothetical protein